MDPRHLTSDELQYEFVIRNIPVSDPNRMDQLLSQLALENDDFTKAPKPSISLNSELDAVHEGVDIVANNPNNCEDIDQPEEFDPLMSRVTHWKNRVRRLRRAHPASSKEALEGYEKLLKERLNTLVTAKRRLQARKDQEEREIRTDGGTGLASRSGSPWDGIDGATGGTPEIVSGINVTSQLPQATATITSASTGTIPKNTVTSSSLAFAKPAIPFPSIIQDRQTYETTSNRSNTHPEVIHQFPVNRPQVNPDMSLNFPASKQNEFNVDSRTAFGEVSGLINYDRWSLGSQQAPPSL